MAKNKSYKKDSATSEEKKENSRRNGGGRGKRGSAQWKNKKKTEEYNKTGPSSAPVNDLSWYTRYPELTVATASIPYPNRPGMGITMNWPTSSEIVNLENTFNIPGVLAIEWSPTVGHSAVPTDPASLVARELYSKVRSKYSGSLEADPPDFVVYLLCLDSVYSYIAYLKRLYRLLTAYTPHNYTYPLSFFKAMGFTQAAVDNMRSEMTKLWQCINELISMSRKFMCPAEFDFMNRHYWLNDNVFTDADSINSQAYIFVQRYYYKFEYLATPGGPLASGAVLAAPSGSSASTVDWLFKFGVDLINALSAWDDAYTINGYLQRAYEGEPSFGVELLAQDERVVPAYVPEVLMQIENLSCRGQFGSLNAAVSQDPTTNSIICDPTVTFGEGSTEWDDLVHLLNIHSDAPGVGDTVIATRMHMSYSRTDQEGVYRVDSGTEIVNGLYYVDDPNGTRVAVSMFQSINLEQGGTIDQNTVNSVHSSLRILSWLHAFAHHPIFWQRIRYNNTTAGHIDSYVRPFFDVGNVTEVNPGQLADIHRICVLSEWNAYNA